MRRFRRRRWRRWLLPALLVAFVLLRGAYDWWFAVPAGPADSPPEGDYELVRVVDGDTLIVRAVPAEADARGAAEVFPVRLLGIDCPESVHPQRAVEPWSKEAAQFTQDFVAAGRVRLQFDRRRIDKYQRRLAYVFVGDRLLNEELLRVGLARLLLVPGDSETMGHRLRTAERAGREQARGLWSHQKTPL